MSGYSCNTLGSTTWLVLGPTWVYTWGSMTLPSSVWSPALSSVSYGGLSEPDDIVRTMLRFLIRLAISFPTSVVIVWLKRLSSTSSSVSRSCCNNFSNASDISSENVLHWLLFEHNVRSYLWNRIYSFEAEILSITRLTTITYHLNDERRVNLLLFICCFL